MRGRSPSRCAPLFQKEMGLRQGEGEGVESIQRF